MNLISTRSSSHQASPGHRARPPGGKTQLGNPAAARAAGDPVWARPALLALLLTTPMLYLASPLRPSGLHQRSYYASACSDAVMDGRVLSRAGTDVSPVTTIIVLSTAATSHQAGGWLTLPPWLAARNRP